MSRFATSCHIPTSAPQDKRKLNEAEPLFREALEAKRNMLGARHPDTLTSINNLAVLLHAAAHLAHVVVGQAHGLLPEGELGVALGGEQADVEMRFGEIHGANVAPCTEKPRCLLRTGLYQGHGSA